MIYFLPFRGQYFFVLCYIFFIFYSIFMIREQLITKRCSHSSLFFVILPVELSIKT